MTLRRGHRALRAGLHRRLSRWPTPVGSNAARLGPLMAGPLAALLLWYRRHVVLLAIVALPLLYFQWQAPVRDVRTLGWRPVGQGVATTSRCWLSSRRQHGPTVPGRDPVHPVSLGGVRGRPAFPLARGWERQLDIKYNSLFYDGPLTPATYDAWLHKLAVRFVAVSDADLDYSAHEEAALIDRGLPYLKLVFEQPRTGTSTRSQNPTPIAQGAATLRSLGPNSLTLQATRPGHRPLRVRFTPYWALGGGIGLRRSDDDGFTTLRLRGRRTVTS